MRACQVMFDDLKVNQLSELIVFVCSVNAIAERDGVQEEVRLRLCWIRLPQYPQGSSFMQGKSKSHFSSS